MSRSANRRLVSCRARCETAAYGTVLFAGLLLSGSMSVTQARPLSAREEGTAVSIVTTQNEKEVRSLEPGTPIERDLQGGQSHYYRIALISGQYVRVVVYQKGIDVRVRAFRPDGNKIAEVDSPNGMNGPEPISLIAEATGPYSFEVRSLEETVEAGRYEIKIEALREATAQDKAQFAAEHLFDEAEQVRKGTAEGKRKGIEKFHEALALYRSAGDRKGEAQTLNNIGVTYWQLGEMENALRLDNEALEARRAAGDQAGEAQTLNNIGMVHWSSGEIPQALDFFNQALPLRRASGDLAGEASTLNNLGLVHDVQGEKLKALDYFNQSLIPRRASGDREAEATTLNNIGMVYRSISEPEKALDYLNEALPIKRKYDDRRGEADILSNIGIVYLSLSDTQRALDYFNQALPLRRATGDPRGEAAVLSNIGVAHRSLGEFQNSMGYFAQALSLAQKVKDRNGQATTLQNIGTVYRLLGQFQKALDHYDQALLLVQATGNIEVQAGVRYAIGITYRLMGEPRKALGYFNESLSLSRAVGDRAGEAGALLAIARAENELGNLAQARPIIEASISIIESLRAGVTSQELRASYFDRVHSYYEFYIDVLMQLHNQDSSAALNSVALEASERGRARSLLELLAEARADIRQGVDESLLKRERSLQQLLNAKSNRQIKMLSSKHTPEQETAIASEISAIITELQQARVRIRATSPHYAALTQPVPLSLKQIQQQLDPDTVLLEYSLGSPRSFLWAVTPTTMTSFELPGREQIEAKARAVYDLLTARNRLEKNETQRRRDKRLDQVTTAYSQAVEGLSQVLLGPVAQQLHGKRLLIVGDGALQYVPFSVLQLSEGNGKSAPLMVGHEVINLPSASAMAVLRQEIAGRKAAPLSVAALADPVFERQDNRVRGVGVSSAAINSTQRAPDVGRAVRDVGLAGEAGRISRLPFSRREAEAILAVVPRGEGIVALDFKASRATAVSAELGRYRIVHFATHGVLDSGHPELSGIVFSLVDEQGAPQDGFLRLHDIYNLNLPAEMVVLSACQTALGKDIRGEGLVGLARGFMYAGAARVVASLWQVDDVATAELMKHFYRGMMQGRLRPAAALQAAQITMWKQKRWTSPYYWAAFVLQGEWK